MESMRRFLVPRVLWGGFVFVAGFLLFLGFLGGFSVVFLFFFPPPLVQQKNRARRGITRGRTFLIVSGPPFTPRFGGSCISARCGGEVGADPVVGVVDHRHRRAAADRTGTAPWILAQVPRRRSALICDQQHDLRVNEIRFIGRRISV